jgi:uncharacterized membrane protein
MIKQQFIQLLHLIRSIFLNGLFTVLPFTLTIALFTFSYRAINNWLTPVYHLEPTYLQSIPGSQIIVVLAVIFLVGLLIKLFFLEPLVHFLESIFFKIPLMKQVYGGIKQLVHAFNIQDELAFKKIVMVPFPTEKSYCIGFLTSEMPQQVTHFNTERYFNIFIPTTPNPTSGFLIQIAEKDIVVINLTRQEAMSLIISGGIIQPDRFKK